MDDETRAAFARMDRWFALNQAQYNELRNDMAGMRNDIAGLRQDVDDLRQEVGALRREINALREEFYRFRDWVTAQFAEIRLAIQQLTVRVERLDRQSGSIG